MADRMWSARMPTTSTSAPLTKIAIVNAQNAGLQIRPICWAESWKAALIAGSMSPRIAKTIDVVTREMQLATNSRDVFMSQYSTWPELSAGNRAQILL